jgi:hypothetical protein
MPHDPCDTTCLATALPKPAAGLTKPGAAPVGGSRQQPAAPGRIGPTRGSAPDAGTVGAKPVPGAVARALDGNGAAGSTGRRGRMPTPPRSQPHRKESSMDPSPLRPSSRTPGHASRLALLFAGLLGAAVAQASLITLNQRPPQLLEYASPTPSVLSRAFATSTFVGTLQQSCIGGNSQAWSCREDVDQQDAQANRVAQSTDARGTTASASRDPTAFNSATAFADYSVANANSRAQSDYGSNKAAAFARYGGDWTETRVEGVNDGTLREAGPFTGSAVAGATGVWVDSFTADADGTVRFVFSVTQHQGATFDGLSVVPGVFKSREGYGFGEYLVQLFDLESTTTYGDGERYPLVEDAFTLLTEASLDFDAESADGRQLLYLEFAAVAGGRYSLVSQLSVEAVDNALLDLFGTASLERIELGQGQQLAFASGTAYSFVFPNNDPQDPGTVPEPTTLGLLLCASLAMGATRRAMLQPAGTACAAQAIKVKVTKASTVEATIARAMRPLSAP